MQLHKSILCGPQWTKKRPIELCIFSWFKGSDKTTYQAWRGFHFIFWKVCDMCVWVKYTATALQKANFDVRRVFSLSFLFFHFLSPLTKLIHFLAVPNTKIHWLSRWRYHSVIKVNNFWSEHYMKVLQFSNQVLHWVRSCHGVIGCFFHRLYPTSEASLWHKQLFLSTFCINCFSTIPSRVIKRNFIQN